MKSYYNGIWSCRQCGASGDTIAYLMKIDGLDFKAALAELGIEGGRPSHRRRRAPAEPRRVAAAPAWTPSQWSEPSETWSAYAAKLLAEAEESIRNQPHALRWLAAHAITEEAVRRYRIGYLPAEGSRYPGRYRARFVLGLYTIAAFFGIGSDAEEEGEGGAEQLREIGSAAAEAFAREPEDAPAPSRRESAGSRNAANRRLQRIRAAQRGGADFTPPDAAVRPSHAQAAGSAAVNLAVHINGMPDGEFGKRVVDALKRRQGELESLIASIVDEQRRLAYG